MKRRVRRTVYPDRLMVRFGASERFALEVAAEREHRAVSQLVRAVTLNWLANQHRRERPRRVRTSPAPAAPTQSAT